MPKLGIILRILKPGIKCETLYEDIFKENVLTENVLTEKKLKEKKI